MRISLDVHPNDLDDIVYQLVEQMGIYNTEVFDGGVTCLIGEKFNVYIYPQKNAFLVRTIEILPKPENV